MQVTLFEQTMPVKTIKLAVVKMPNGRIYHCRADQVHPGNFPETATIYNSYERFMATSPFDAGVAIPSDKYSDFERDAYCCGKNPDPMEVMQQWHEKCAKVRAAKIRGLQFLRELKKQGGFANYNYPKEAQARIAGHISHLFLGHIPTNWLLSHFGLI